MNIILNNFDRANEVLNFSTKEAFIAHPGLITCGWYKYSKTELSALYIVNGRLSVFYDNDSFAINSNSKATVEGPADLRTFKLFNSGDLVLSFKYETDSEFGLKNSNLFGFVEKEDFDWGLFLSNIINNKSRQDIILNRLPETNK